MSDSSAWRMACCQQTLNAISQHPKACLMMAIIPFRRKGFSGQVLTVVVHTEGRTHASCRHEIDRRNFTHWWEYVETLTAEKLGG